MEITENQVQTNSTEMKPSNPMRIWIFNSLLLLSIISAIILSFTGSGKQSQGAGAGLSFVDGKYAVRVINIYNLIEYEKMLPHVKQALKQAYESESIKAVILRINSGGGTVGASHEIYSLVKEFKTKTKKPVIAVMGDMAASGGYYIACSADEIIAGPGTLTGSIGVIMTSFTFKKLFEDYGVKQTIIKSGQFKDIGSAIGRDKTPEELLLLQKLIDDSYRNFFNIVLSNRKGKKGLTEAKLRQFADGRIFTGDQALTIGLVDAIGGMSDAERKLQSILETKDDLILIEDGKSPFSEILGSFGAAKSTLSITDFLERANGLPLYLYCEGRN